MWVVRDGPVGKPSWGVGDVLLTRREFIRSSAVVGAVGSVGGFSLLGCHGGAHWQAPESIDNTGATDVSAALTNWLASTGAPGDAFELRRRPDGSPGRYWVPRGVRIGKPMLFDMKGCELFTGLTLGVHDPNLEACIAAHPPLWNDSGEQTGPDGSWPTHRVVLLISSSNVTLHSSVENARIQGSARDVGYRGDEQLVGRRHPTGCIFHRRDERPPYAFGDGQHGIRLGGSAGTHSDTNHYSAILLDLTNISVEFVHSDGVYLNDNHDHVTIRGPTGRRAVAGRRARRGTTSTSPATAWPAGTSPRAPPGPTTAGCRGTGRPASRSCLGFTTPAVRASQRISAPATC
jgi:hypothetical protein